MIDSEAGLEENEDEQLLSSNSEDQPTEEMKLTQDELKRLYLDDFSSDDEVSGQQRRVICRRQETPSVTYP